MSPVAASEEPETSGQRTSGVAPLVAGLVMITVGVIMIREAVTVEVGRTLISGPRLFPAVITIAFTALALIYLGQQVIRMIRARSYEGRERFGNTLRVVALVALLVAYGLLLEPVGYLLCTFVLFVAGSFLLGSRAWVRDLITGVLLSLGVYLLFTRLLSVSLPAGVIPLG